MKQIVYCHTIYKRIVNIYCILLKKNISMCQIIRFTPEMQNGSKRFWMENVRLLDITTLPGIEVLLFSCKAIWHAYEK